MNRYSKKIDKKSSKTEKEEPKFSIFSISSIFFYSNIYSRKGHSFFKRNSNRNK